MAHAQSSPRGLFAKARIDVGGFSITANSTGIKLGARYISTNTTGNTST